MEVLSWCYRSVLYKSLNDIFTCVEDSTSRVTTSLLQPTKPASFRAVFSAVLTLLTPSSTVRAWTLLTVTSALPVALIALQTASYWLKRQTCLLLIASMLRTVSLYASLLQAT